MRTPPPSDPLGLGDLGARRESTERRILEGAAGLIAGGVAWQQLGIRQIAERAQISRTAFYDFFSSKNEVLEHLVTGLHEDLTQTLVEPVGDGRTVLDPEHLRALLARIADLTLEHGPIYRALLDAITDDRRLDELWDDLLEVYVGLIIASIEHIRVTRADVPRGPDARSLAEVLLAMTERTMLFLLRADPASRRRPERLESLAIAWERTVFGAPSAA